jgi:hypothetical protein
MQKIYFLFITLISNIACSQNIDLKIQSDNNSIPFATILDSTKGIIEFSDISGMVKLKKGDYYLTISHVSFEDYHLIIENIKEDTTIIINLESKTEILETVAISSSKIDKTKKYNYGALNHRTSSSITLKEKILMGVIIAVNTLNGENPKYLRSIMFKMDNIKKTKKENFVIELKLFGFNKNNQLDTVPLNSQPIYLKSINIKKINEIMLSEKIRLSENGLFISIELPEIMKDKKTYTITFWGDYYSDIPLTYIKKNIDGKWTNDDLLHGHKLPTGNYWAMNFGITYWKIKNK